MRTTVDKSAALVVRPRSSWRQNLILSMAAFGLTIAGVHFSFKVFCPNSGGDPGSKAVAIVTQKPVEDREISPIGTVLEASIKLKNIKNRILSPTFMQQALHDCGIGISPAAENNARNASILSAEQLRQGLDVFVKPESAAGGNRITLELTLKQSPDASRIARALADRFVREYQTFWAAELREARLAASAQADQARQAHREAEEKLQAFKDEVSKQGQSTAALTPLQPRTAQTETRQGADNPAWVELNDKLESLHRQEAEMLVNKTPQHPDVQYIRGRIADFEAELASTPKFAAEFSTESAAQQAISNSGDNTSTPDNEKTIQDGNSRKDIVAGIGQNEMTEILKPLQDAVELAEREYQDKLQREERIFEAGGKEPIFSVNVTPVALAKTEYKTSRRLIELMLFSGFAMAIGVSIMSSGVTTEPVLATIADLELLLPAPIIGVVPSEDRSFDAVAIRRRQLILRWTLMLLGGLIVLGSIGWVYWFISHQ